MSIKMSVSSQEEKDKLLEEIAVRTGDWNPLSYLKPEDIIVQDENCHKTDTVDEIHFYEQDFYVFSNFSAFAVKYAGILFPTSEHAYHYMKFAKTDPGLTAEISKTRSAHEAFVIAQKYKDKRREDWDEVKVAIMREILVEKALQHEYIRQRLVQSGNKTLIEDSWRDDFWGWGPNKDGKNVLGKLWMSIREQYNSRNGFNWYSVPKDETDELDLKYGVYS